GVVNPRGERPSAPGWYPDPDGVPGMVRWWTGTEWSGVTTPAGPGVAVRASPPASSADEPTGPPEERRARSPRALWTAGGAVLAIVAVLLVALVISGSASRTPD